MYYIIFVTSLHYYITISIFVLRSILAVTIKTSKFYVRNKNLFNAL